MLWWIKGILIAVRPFIMTWLYIFPNSKVMVINAKYKPGMHVSMCPLHLYSIYYPISHSWLRLCLQAAVLFFCHLKKNHRTYKCAIQPKICDLNKERVLLKSIICSNIGLFHYNRMYEVIYWNWLKKHVSQFRF